MESGRIREVGTILRVERCEERAILIDGAQRTRLLRIVMTVAQTLLAESLGILFLTQGLG